MRERANAFAAGLLCALSLTACPSDPECTDGFTWNGERCVAEDVDGSVADGGTDVGGDVPCGGCTAPLVCTDAGWPT